MIGGLVASSILCKKNTHDTRDRVLSKRFFDVFLACNIFSLESILGLFISFFLAGGRRARAVYGKWRFQSSPRI